MTDSFADTAPSLTSPLERGFSITPHDTNALAHVTRELYVGTGGTIVMELKHGDNVTLANVPDGARLPYRAAKVLATSTTASGMVGLY